MVGIATKLRAGGTGVRFPVGGEFPISKHFQTSHGAHPASISTGIGVLS
jgi:hypothetical protein